MSSNCSNVTVKFGFFEATSWNSPNYAKGSLSAHASSWTRVNETASVYFEVVNDLFNGSFRRREIINMISYKPYIGCHQVIRCYGMGMARQIDAKACTVLFDKILKLKESKPELFNISTKSFKFTLDELEEYDFITEHQKENYLKKITTVTGESDSSEANLSKSEIIEKVFEAILYSRSKELQRLLKKYPEAVNWEKNGDTPLQEASGGYCIKDKNVEIVKVLLKHGADVNSLGHCKYQRFTALHRAAYGNHFKIAKLLLEAGADPDIPHYAVMENQLIPEEKPIHSSKSSRFIQLLVKDYGVNVRDTDDEGRTVLDYLVEEYVRRNKNFPDFEGLRKINHSLEGNYLKECISFVLSYFSDEEVKTVKINFFKSSTGKRYDAFGMIDHLKKSIK